MFRFVGGLLAVVLGAGLAGGQPEKSPRAQKVARLEAKFQQDEAELKKKLQNAQDAEERQQVEFLLKELYAFTAEEAVELAEEAKKDPAAVDACVFALQLLGKMKLTGENMDKAMSIILEHHVESPKIQPVLEFMSVAGRKGQEFLDTVVEKTKNKDVQALAIFYTALAKDAQATSIEGNTPNEHANRLREEAADLIEKAVGIAPDVKVGTSTLKEAAVLELASMRIAVGKPVPDVEGVDPSGKKVKLSSFQGKVVLFDFWATWCGPCIRMIPHERELVKKMEGRPFALLAVNVDKDRAQFDDFRAMENLPWEHWVDGGQGPVARTFKVRAFPTMFLIDAQGVLRKKWIGNPGDEIMDKAIEELVAEAEKTKK